MGGDCGVSSWLGEGSTFWFTIQVRADTGRPREGRSPQPELAGVRALVVDDNGTLRRVLSRYMTDWGMSVTTAESGPAALAELRSAMTKEQPFALVVLDRSMPGMDGLALKNAIVSDADLAPALVLMIGLGEERELGPAGDAGVGSWLSKPIHLDDLNTGVRVALGRQAGEPAPAKGTTRATADESGRGLLLLAEDNLINQKVAVAMLTGAGYRVDTVPNGAAALDAAAAQPYDAILMDCQMPEMNGYEATATIRIREGSTHHTPIIAMTAGARQEDRERCRAAGMDNYLSKPLSKDALLALVGQSVTNGRALASARSGTRTVSEEDVVIDPVVVDELRLLSEVAGEDFLDELMAQFVVDTEPLLAELREALDAGDAEGVGRIAHTIKGGSGQLGGRRLAASCDRLEENAARARLTEGRRDLLDIATDYAALRQSWAEQLGSASEAGQRLDA
jgi:two-component system, sensor histidine kinase and response regulator